MKLFGGFSTYNRVLGCFLLFFNSFPFFFLLLLLVFVSSFFSVDLTVLDAFHLFYSISLFSFAYSLWFYRNLKCLKTFYNLFFSSCVFPPKQVYSFLLLHFFFFWQSPSSSFIFYIAFSSKDNLMQKWKIFGRYCSNNQTCGNKVTVKL